MINVCSCPRVILSPLPPTSLGSVSPLGFLLFMPSAVSILRALPSTPALAPACPTGTSPFNSTDLQLPSRCTFLPFFIPTGVPRPTCPKPSSLLSPQVVFCSPVGLCLLWNLHCLYLISAVESYITTDPSPPSPAAASRVLTDMCPVSFSGPLLLSPAVLPPFRLCHSLAWIPPVSLCSWHFFLGPAPRRSWI